MNPKPRQLDNLQKRLLDRRKAAMTIAIGMACYGGIIVAADTQIAIGTALQKASKLYISKAKSGPLAIAFASDDANATRTLINRIQKKLGSTDCKDADELEIFICEQMTAWRSAYTVSPPSMQLIVGCRLNKECPRLFFCEPPNTFIEPDDGYVAGGSGGSDVTDSLHSTLFESGKADVEVQSALRRVAYLMYRAKNDNIYCGKSTYCALVSWNCPGLPVIVNHLDFEVAEKYAGQLDFLLRMTSNLYLGGSEDKIEENANGIAKAFKSSATFRTVQFHDTSGQVITL
jgi:20S proteasome alpha/beta subunit